LLVPTAKSLTHPVTAPDPASHAVDHFKCYKVRLSRGAPTFPRIPNVSIVDQFQQPGLVDVTHPALHAGRHERGGITPGVPVKHPRRAKHTGVSGIFLNNQFSPEIVDTAKEGEFCVPSLKLLQQPVP
jgi:hypothetical protein